MKVLILSPYPEQIGKMLEANGDEWSADIAPLNEDPNVDFIVSYGYRHMIREPILTEYAGRIINLHISYLPWNRGSDPNFWSFVDDTPKGVTIHQIDAGLDTGGILAQDEVDFSGYDDTLEGSYERLRCAVEILFRRTWPTIRAGKIEPRQQVGRGSYHRSADKTELWKRLPLGYGTPVAALKGISR